jgi:hypothetical protein
VAISGLTEAVGSVAAFDENGNVRSQGGSSMTAPQPFASYQNPIASVSAYLLDPAGENITYKYMDGNGDIYVLLYNSSSTIFIDQVNNTDIHNPLILTKSASPEVAPEPGSEPSSEPASEPSSEPASEPSSEPAPEPAPAEPAVQSPVDSTTINVVSGWNMIGTSYAGVLSGSVIMNGTLYWYNGTQYGGSIDSLQVEPNKGYWIKCSASGVITLTFN